MHEGHRQRMYEKLKNGDNLYEHEVLEILLYTAFPRVDTNPIAHNLLERFPGIAAVVEADMEELVSVEGVGEQTARFLKCIGRCFEYFNKADCFGVLKTRADVYEFAKMRLRNKVVEVLEIYALDKNGKVIRVLSLTTEDDSRVDAQPDEVMRFISLVKPNAIIIAHNHTGSDARPSAADDKCTKQVMLICSMNNVLLRDHVIVANGNIYSYYDSGKLNEIQYGYSIGNLIKDD